MGHADQEDNERIIAMHREKYGPPDSGGWLPASMRKGSDKLPFFWIGYALIFGLLALYFGIQSGG
ncbi:hypothetical protein ACF1BE_18785 [Streptomyces sp. NPDC014991]|uniref:hypothetical protein n=1 Tax=Streptomyces sp. NPDC014991 TaxID=3364935 RepID=UPI0037004082